jgi:hypothetical protein
MELRDQAIANREPYSILHVDRFRNLGDARIRDRPSATDREDGRCLDRLTGTRRSSAGGPADSRRDRLHSARNSGGSRHS